MKTQRIKNYMLLALIIVVGLYTIWHNFSDISDDQTPDNSNLIVNDAPSDDTLISELNQSTVTEESEDVSDPIESLESTQNPNQSALDSISGYDDITGIVWIVDLPRYVADSYKLYNLDGWNGKVDGQTDGTKAGGHFGNYDNQLPIYDTNGNEISYKEFDVNNKIEGQSRDAERFVVGSDQSVYYTSNHYDTFVKIIE